MCSSEVPQSSSSFGFISKSRSLFVLQKRVIILAEGNGETQKWIERVPSSLDRRSVTVV